MNNNENGYSVKKMINRMKDSRVMGVGLVACMVVLFGWGLFNHQLVIKLFHDAVKVVNPLIAGLVVAYLLDFPAVFIERKVFKKMEKRGLARTLSVIITILLALLIVVYTCFKIVPQLYESVMSLFINAETYFEQLKLIVVDLADTFGIVDVDFDELFGTWNDVVSKIGIGLFNNMSGIVDMSFSVGIALFKGFIVFAVSVYMLLDKTRLLNSIKVFFMAILPENKYNYMSRLTLSSNDMFAKYLGSNIIDSLIVGVVSLVFCLAVGIPYAMLMAVIAGVTNFIPNFGPWIGGIPSFIIIMIISPIKAVVYLVFMVVMQSIDGYILKPILFGDSTGISPFWAFVALIIFGNLFGIVGMLIGIPIFAIISNIYNEIISTKLKNKGYDEFGEPLEEQAIQDVLKEQAMQELEESMNEIE